MKILILTIILYTIIINTAYTQSSLEIQTGAVIEIGSGALVCADIQTGDGEITGTGTWCGGVMPVELTAFLSEINENDVTLRWITSREINNSGFEIHRSVSGNSGHWEMIGFVGGRGSTELQSEYLFTDNDLPVNKYSYRLKQIDFNGNFEYFSLSNEVIIGAPEKFELRQNYPNPFNPVTKISYKITEDSHVSLKVFNTAGVQVYVLADKKQTAGNYTVTFDAGNTVNGINLPSGVYFYVLKITGNGNNTITNTAVKKMMLVK